MQGRMQWGCAILKIEHHWALWSLSIFFHHFSSFFPSSSFCLSLRCFSLPSRSGNSCLIAFAYEACQLYGCLNVSQSIVFVNQRKKARRRDGVSFCAPGCGPIFFWVFHSKPNGCSATSAVGHNLPATPPMSTPKRFSSDEASGWSQSAGRVGNTSGRLERLVAAALRLGGRLEAIGVFIPEASHDVGHVEDVNEDCTY